MSDTLLNIVMNTFLESAENKINLQIGMNGNQILRKSDNLFYTQVSRAYAEPSYSSKESLDRYEKVKSNALKRFEGILIRKEIGEESNSLKMLFTDCGRVIFANTSSDNGLELAELQVALDMQSVADAGKVYLEKKKILNASLEVLRDKKKEMGLLDEEVIIVDESCKESFNP